MKTFDAIEGRTAAAPDRSKILLVDDHELNLMALRDLLRRDEVDVLCAKSGREALELLLIHDVTLAVIDVEMPVMDGFELAELMRGVERAKRVPIIFVTAGMRDAERRFRAYEAGAVDFLYKPIETEVLKSKVNVFLALERQRRDLTRLLEERTEAERRVRESEEQFSAVFNQTTSGIAQVDLTGHFTLVNDRYCHIVGRSREEVLMLRMQDITHQEDLAVNVEQFRALIEGRSNCVVEKRYVRPDGSVVWVHNDVSAIRDGNGIVHHVAAVVMDITERKRAEEQLKQFNVQLERQVTERTTKLLESEERLRALATELNLAEQRERKRLATELHDHLQQMLVLGKLKLGQGKRLAESIPACAQIINDTDEVLSDALNYTRTLAAELSPPVLRDHGLSAGLKWLGEYMKKHEMDVTVAVPEGAGPTVAGDQVMLVFQSVRELLINSSKHSGTRTAWVTMQERGRELTVEVRDEGAGFDLAAAAAADTSSGGLSSKFGLYSIRERMRALSGSFAIESAPGKGTTATLTLPLARRDVREVRDERDEKKSGSKPVSPLLPVSRVSHSAHIRVLLVDDHAMVRQGLRAVLDGYDDVEIVGEAWNGEEAIAAAEQLRPHVVLMDINMPKKNGIEATGEIKARYPDINVIGLSVNAGGDNQTALLKAGGAMLLTKEAAVEQLYGAIQEAVRKPVRSEE